MGVLYTKDWVIGCPFMQKEWRAGSAAGPITIELFYVHCTKKMAKYENLPKLRQIPLGVGQKVVPYAERMEGRLGRRPKK